MSKGSAVQGMPEASIDLARLAGLYFAGQLAEIIKKEDGEMVSFARTHEDGQEFNLKIISVADLIKYRLKTESLVNRGEEVHLPTQ